MRSVRTHAEETRPKTTRAKTTGAKLGALTLASLLALGVLGMPAATAATGTDDSSPTSTSGTDGRLENRIRLACARVPNVSLRVTAMLTRLPADADTPGSIAALQARQAQLEAAGRTRAATLLANRIGVLQAKLPVLRTRQSDLQAIAARCDELGYGA